MYVVLQKVVAILSYHCMAGSVFDEGWDARGVPLIGAISRAKGLQRTRISPQIIRKIPAHQMMISRSLAAFRLRKADRSQHST